MKNKKILLLLAATFLMASPSKNVEAKDFKINIEEKALEFNDQTGQAKIINGRTMVPIRVIGEDMGYKVDYSKDSWSLGERKVFIKNTDTEIVLEIDSDHALINDQVISLDVEPVIIKSRTYVPLRFVSEAFDRDIDYKSDKNNHYISIGKEDKNLGKINRINRKMLDRDLSLEEVKSLRKEIQENKIEFPGPQVEAIDYFLENLKYRPSIKFIKGDYNGDGIDDIAFMAFDQYDDSTDFDMYIVDGKSKEVLKLEKDNDYSIVIDFKTIKLDSKKDSIGYTQRMIHYSSGSWSSFVEFRNGQYQVSRAIADKNYLNISFKNKNTFRIKSTLANKHLDIYHKDISPIMENQDPFLVTESEFESDGKSNKDYLYSIISPQYSGMSSGSPVKIYVKNEYLGNGQWKYKGLQILDENGRELKLK